MSTDNSRQFLAALNHPNIKVIYNEKNQGCTATRKRLTETAETEVVAILDPDDCLYPNATERLLHAFEKSDAEFIYSRFHIYDATLTTLIGEGGTPYPDKGTTLERGFISHLQAFKRALYDKVPGYNEEILYAEDRDIIYQFEEVTIPKFIDECLYKYRILPTSQSNNKEKKEIGFHSHYVARKEALQRRNIKGIEFYFYCLLFKLDKARSSELNPKWIRKCASKLHSKLVRLDKKIGIRKALKPG
jgi:glycosyltransferase involved in cell wall biosynthesis